MTVPSSARRHNPSHRFTGTVDGSLDWLTSHPLSSDRCRFNSTSLWHLGWMTRQFAAPPVSGLFDPPMPLGLRWCKWGTWIGIPHSSHLPAALAMAAARTDSVNFIAA